MKRLLLIVLPLLLIVGCSKPEPINYETTLVEREGVFYTKDTNKPYSGPVFSLYEDGKKKEEGSLKDGKKDVLWTYWDKNDGKEYKGTLIKETDYPGGEPDIKTLGNGSYLLWMEGGYIGKSFNLKDGKEDGLEIFWYENGQKESEYTNKDGKLDGLNISWYSNGQKGVERTFKNGKLDGLFTQWYEENGQKSREITYKDGKKEGIETRFHGNGNKEMYRTWKNDELDGLSTLWFMDGQKNYEENYKDGKIISSQSWNRDGSVRE